MYSQLQQPETSSMKCGLNPIASNNYNSLLTWSNAAVVHQQEHHLPWHRTLKTY